MLNEFKIVSKFLPTKQQQKSTNTLFQNLKTKNEQVLLGITGTGKTFTIANLIEKMQKTTLVLVHNKTLAGQLYGELKELFPNNRVEYYVSNFDYYQPEAYLPAKGLYIDKTSKQNSSINMMRNSTYQALITRKDTIVVASIAAIFGAYDPSEYKKMCYEININDKYKNIQFSKILVRLGYIKNNTALSPGTFSLRGTDVEIMMNDNNEFIYKIDLLDDKINKISKVDYLTKNVIKKYKKLKIFPGNDYIFDKNRIKLAIERIKIELNERILYFSKKDLFIEKQRISERVNLDVEMLEEFGMCSGIENYSMHLDLRSIYSIPYTLIDYFGNDWLLIVDESHMTLPQIRGMYNNDRSRKTTLVDYGFRLPSALGNRPLNFNEFMDKIHKAVYVSATPGEYEMDVVNNNPVVQIIRPTGLLDPTIKTFPKRDQMQRIIHIIKNCKKKNERVIILALTIKSAEDIVDYFQDQEFKSYYIHNKLKTLERLIIINSLRKGKLDVVVGINLLREGIDIPEVSTIIILDGDREGFLRDYRSLIQMFGRVSRNKNGNVVIFCDQLNKSLKKAIYETNERRKLQIDYNKTHNIIPKTIIKPIMDVPYEEETEQNLLQNKKILKNKKEKQKFINELKQQMLLSAKNLEFEKAAKLRDMLLEIDSELFGSR